MRQHLLESAPAERFRRLFFLLGIFLLLTLLSVRADISPLQASTLTLNVSQVGTIQVERQGARAAVDFVTARLENFPRNDLGQDVTSLITDPVAEGTSTLRFSWQHPPDEFSYAVHSIVFLSAREQPLGRVVFPLQNLPPDVVPYLSSTNHIDITPTIRAQAAALATTDDQFLVVGNIAAWIHQHISYNLSTLTTDVAQPSSWVLQNGYGVCDEITSLFISMLRSIGIPARYVSGVAYTNMDIFQDQWVNHAWAEVYFPGYGWIPYDITYGEFAQLDSAHLVMYKGLDTPEASVLYEYQAREAQLTTSMATAIDIIAQGPPRQQQLTYAVSTWKPHISSNSWNVLLITVGNPTERYRMSILSIGQTELLTFSQQQLFAIVPPHQHVDFAIPFSIGPLDQTYTYTFPVTVYDALNTTARVTFTADRQGEFVSEELAATYANHDRNGVQATFVCIPAESMLYENDTTTLACALHAPVNEQVTYCLAQDCTTLQHDQQSAVTFTVHATQTATLVVTARGQSINSTTFVPITPSALPNVTISELMYPSGIGYDKKGTLEFVLGHDSIIPPRNVLVLVSGGFINESWTFPELGKEHISLSFQGRHLSKKTTPLTITVMYDDAKGRQYTTSTTFSIMLADLSFGERVELAMTNFGHWIADIF